MKGLGVWDLKLKGFRVFGQGFVAEGVQCSGSSWVPKPSPPPNDHGDLKRQA